MRGKSSAAIAAALVVAAAAGLVGLGVWRTDGNQSPVAASVGPAIGQSGAVDSVGSGDPSPLPTFDPTSVEDAVRANHDVVQAIGGDFQVFETRGVSPATVSVTVKTPAPVVVPRTPFTWSWPVDEFGAPVIDGDPGVRPPLQYFRLSLDVDLHLREIIPVLGETVEPGVAPTRPPRTTPPPSTLVSPEQIAAAEHALRTDPAITEVIGTDFIVLEAGPATANASEAYGVGFQVNLAEPRMVPVGVPVIGGGDERTPGTLGPNRATYGPVRYIGVVLRPDNRLWWYYPIPDELGAHYEDEAATTTTGD